MKKEKSVLAQTVAKLAYETSKKSVNATCNWFFHQKKMPESLKNLENFREYV